MNASAADCVPRLMISGAVLVRDTFGVFTRFKDIKYLNINPPIFCLLLLIAN